MSREIEFRGLRKDGKGWVYGFLLSSNRIMVWDRDVCMRSESFEVHPETVGQQVGKQDIEGQNIWEGDEVEFYIRNTRYVGTIAWGSIGFWLVGEVDKLNWVEHWKIKKVGTIHEHPELLEAKP